jgi:hypothetical protein
MAHWMIASEVSHRIAAAARERGRRDWFASWIVGSAILHALILPPLLLSTRPGQPAVIIPLDIVVLADQTAGPQQPDSAIVPLQEAGAPATPTAPPVGVTPSRKPPDELDIKLHALAELRQPSVDTHLSKKDLGLARQSAMSEEAEPGSYPTYAVRDFIRAQVERRWGLDLRTLGDSNYSVLIRVEMTSTGAVTKAEIADTARFNSDTTYRAIALSARNAVLLSSPFVLPGGPYSDRMVFTLSLNTKEALR